MLKQVEKILAVLMLFYTTGAIVPFFGEHAFGGSASKAELAVQIPLYSLTFFFIGVRWPTVLRAMVSAKWTLALVFLALVSAAWSQAPMFSLRRGAILIATTAFGIYFGARFDVDEQLRLLARTYWIIMPACVLFALFLPHYGIDTSAHNGVWQGVFAQKNSLARAMVLGSIVFLYAQPRPVWLRWFGVLGAMGLLLLSKSATGAIVLAILLGLQPLLRALRAQLTVAVPVFILAALIAGAGIASRGAASGALLHLVHRDPGLTGRTSLWAGALAAIRKRPLLGYGFEGFWLGMKGESAMVVQQIHWSPPNSHNGFVDLMLEEGLLGLGTFIVGYLILWRQALRFLKQVPGRIPLWLCSYLLYTLVYNFSERTILDQNSIYWVLYSSVAVSLYLDFPLTEKDKAVAPKYEVGALPRTANAT